MGELAGGLGLSELRDGDVEPGEAHGMARGGEAAGVPELGQDRDARELADAELALQGAAAALAAGEGGQLRLERREPLVDVSIRAARWRSRCARNPAARAGLAQHGGPAPASPRPS